LMSSITVPIKAEKHPHVRPLNIIRDLSAVADLIELCFSSTTVSVAKRNASRFHAGWPLTR